MIYPQLQHARPGAPNRHPLLRLQQKYSPDQPRVPAGSPEGGQFSGDGGGAAGSATPTPAEFIAARDRSTRIHVLSPLKPEDLSEHTLITNKEQTAGVAVDPHGDLQNLFNNGAGKGAAAQLVTQAIASGARTLDAYDGFLPSYYRQFGFIETGRIKFNPAFAHHWDSGKYGQPDVVFMAWHGYPAGGAAGAITRASSRQNWISNDRSSRYYTDYEQAKSDSRRAGANRSVGRGLWPPAEPAGNRPGAGAGAGARSDLAREFDESQHPRVPAGSPEGGQFTSGEGGEAGAVDEHGLNLDEQQQIQDWLDGGYRELRTDPEFGKILEKLPLFNGKVWRGGQLRPEDLNKLHIGDIYEIGKFSSASQNEAIAQEFSFTQERPGRQAVIFEVFDRGRKIPRDYAFAAGLEREAEVVLMTGDKYKILGVDRNRINEHGVKYTAVTMQHA